MPEAAADQDEGAPEAGGRCPSGDMGPVMPGRLQSVVVWLGPAVWAGRGSPPRKPPDESIAILRHQVRVTNQLKLSMHVCTCLHDIPAGQVCQASDDDSRIGICLARRPQSPCQPATPRGQTASAGHGAVSVKQKSHARVAVSPAQSRPPAPPREPAPNQAGAIRFGRTGCASQATADPAPWIQHAPGG